MKKIYILIVVMFLMALIGVIALQQKTVSMKDSDKPVNIMDYTIVWGETSHVGENCYIVLKTENNLLDFESKITDGSIISCGEKKGAEIMFNAIQELKAENDAISRGVNPLDQKIIDDLNTRIDSLENRIETLEAKLQNVTQPLTEPEPSPQLYECSSRPEVGNKTCLGGFSSGIGTRCYNAFKIGWTNCDLGWVEI